MNEQYERELVRRFILPDKKPRYEFALPRMNHRYAALVKLFANDEIDLRFAIEGAGVVGFLNLSSVSEGPEGYIMSLDENIDGKVFPFEEAMDFAYGSRQGIIVYFPKQQVAYYQGEHGDEYVLHKPS
jgi:hypothetical protein